MRRVAACCIVVHSFNPGQGNILTTPSKSDYLAFAILTIFGSVMVKFLVLNSCLRTC